MLTDSPRSGAKLGISLKRTDCEHYDQLNELSQIKDCDKRTWVVDFDIEATLQDKYEGRIKIPNLWYL